MTEVQAAVVLDQNLGQGLLASQEQKSSDTSSSAAITEKPVVDARTPQVATLQVEDDEELLRRAYGLQQKFFSCPCLHPEDRSCCWQSNLCCFQRATTIFKLKTRLAYVTLGLKAVGFIILIFVSVWNIAKLPYYLTSEDNLPATTLTYNASRCLNSTEYWCHGMEGTVTMGHDVPGYRSGKIASHPVTFLAFHVIVGATVLICAALTIVNPALRRKYGYFFFVSSFVLGFHCMPATMVMTSHFKLILFWITSFVVTALSFVGILTLLLYDRLKAHADRLLLACWTLCTIGAMGAAFAEFFSIIVRSAFAVSHGYYQSDSDFPAALSGLTPYDKCDCLGFVWFVSILWIVLVWILAVVAEVLRWQGIVPSNFWTCCFYGKDGKSYHLHQDVDEDDGAGKVGNEQKNEPSTGMELDDFNKKGSEQAATQVKAGMVHKFFEVNEHGDIILKINSEVVRMFMHFMFWVMMVFAIIITAATGPVDSPVVKQFGYTSITVNLETTPARQLTAMIHPVLEVSMILYIGLLWLRKARAFQNKLISSLQMAISNYATLFLVTITLWSRLVFVVETKTNVPGHVLAFFGLQLMFTIITSEHFALSVSLNMLPYPLWIGVLHVGLLVSVAVIKLFLLVSVLVHNPIYLVEEVPWTKGIVQFVDILWLILHSVVPLFCAYLARHITPPTIVVLPNPNAVWLPGTPKPDEDMKHDQESDEVAPKKKFLPHCLTNSMSDADLHKMQAMQKKGIQGARDRLLVMVHPTNAGVSIEVNSETIRMMTYLLFWSMVVFAIIITKISTTPEQIADSALMATFGFNNVCIYWDYSPSRELTAMFYPLVEFYLITYLCLNFIRKYHAFLSKHISHFQFQCEIVMTPFLFVMIAWFRMIFVEGAFDNVPGHTLGFFGLQISLLLVLFSNYGYHSSNKSLVGSRYLSIAYLFAAVGITVVKISLASSVFVERPIYAVGTESGNAFAHAVDILWMIFQSVLPAIFSYRNQRRTPASIIHVQ